MSEGPNRIDYQETPDITEIHAAVQREKAEPSANVTPMPLWLTGVCAFATAWAAAYLGIFNGGFSGTVYNEYDSSPAVLFPLPAKQGAAVATTQAVENPVEQGKQVFNSVCAACHQSSGMGLAGQFPPLKGSDWVQGSEKRLVGILLKGLQGSVSINGQPFATAAVMPAWETQLSPKKIAAVACYIRQEWGNHAPQISEAQVKSAKEAFSDHPASWTEAELLKIPADATLEGGAPAAAPSAPAAPEKGAPAAASAAPTTAATAPAAAAAPAASANATPEQLALGKSTYMAICVACHQPTGAGLPMVFPPLTDSPYVNGNTERFAAMILKGNMGPFTIGGKPFGAAPMTPQESVLDDEKIAAVMTFVRANFNNHSGPVAAADVAAARKKFADRKTSWTQPELDAWPEAGK